MDQYGSIRRLGGQEIKSGRDDRKALANDMNNQTIESGDVVEVIDKDRKQKGVVLHIHRGVLWCHSRDVAENSGVFISKGRSCVVVSAKGGRNINDSNAGRGQPVPMSRGAHSSGGMGRGRGRGGRDPLVGQTVRITKGSYKGYMGLVRDVTDVLARIELQSQARTVSVEKVKLELVMCAYTHRVCWTEADRLILIGNIGALDRQHSLALLCSRLMGPLAVALRPTQEPVLPLTKAAEPPHTAAVPRLTILEKALRTAADKLQRTMGDGRPRLTEAGLLHTMVDAHPLTIRVEALHTTRVEALHTIVEGHQRTKPEAPNTGTSPLNAAQTVSLNSELGKKQCYECVRSCRQACVVPGRCDTL